MLRGTEADERPIRFHLGDRDFMVEEVLDQWYSPDETFYKVCADDGNLYSAAPDRSRQMEVGVIPTARLVRCG
jgi:hypothetical protein